MAPSPARHPMERLLCPRDRVHDATSSTRVNENPPPPSYHLTLHIPTPTHRPFYFPELVRLQNVVAYREGTASARKTDTSRASFPADDKISCRYFLKEVLTACKQLEKNEANDRFIDETTGKRIETMSEPEETRDLPCRERCCSGESPLDIDRVIYRFMGEARPNMCLLEALHFEVFLPDRLDLRYIQVPKRVVDRFGLMEGMLVWISSSQLDCVPHRSRYRYRDVSDLVPYYVAWRVNDLIGVIGPEKEEMWHTSFSICATIADVDTEKSQESTYYAGVCSQFPYPVFGRASLLDDTDITPQKVQSAVVTKRDASWLYSVEPIRNFTLYRRVIGNIDSTNTQNGYRIDKLSTEKLEDSLCMDYHAKWFNGNKLSPQDFTWSIERSLALGTAMARVDSRDKAVECFGEFSGFLNTSCPPELVLYPSHEQPPSHYRYAILTFNSTITKKLYSLSVNCWQKKEKYRVAHGRRSLAIEELSRQPHVEGLGDLPCAIRFSSSPTNALDDLLRSDLEYSSEVAFPVVFADLYDVVIPGEENASEIPRQSRRLLASSMGPRMSTERSVRFACAHPTTSFAVCGEELAGKTITAAAISLATPRRHNKLLLTTTRKDARTLWYWFLKMFYTDVEFCKLDRKKMPKQKMPHKTRYEDSSIVDKEEELKEFLTWPTGDVVVATIDSILQIMHHHHDDPTDALLPFLRDVHTVIIDNAETVTEAYFYVLMKSLHPTRVVLVGDNEKAYQTAATRLFAKQAVQPILYGIVSYTRPHSMPVMQIRRSTECERKRATFFMRAPIRDFLLSGLVAYTEGCEALKLKEVLSFLKHNRVFFHHVAILTIDSKHKETIENVCAKEEELPEVHVLMDFVGQVRPVVILLGGWYGTRYWSDSLFVDLYSTLYLDMLIFIGFDNVFKLRNWCEQTVRRSLVQKHLCEFPKKKK